MRYFILIFIILFSSKHAEAQPASKDSLAFQLFAEVYASSIPNRPFNNVRPGFFYNYTKANEAGVNLALARMHYTSNRFRTNLGVIAGDYQKANLAGENGIARYIYELNAGYKLSKKEDLWIDAGVLPSHIGIESPLGISNRTATRSIVADNSPYYETGIRVTYNPNEHWNFALLTLNGWQRISAPLDQLGANWGMQVRYAPSSSVSFNSSSFIGKVESNQKMLTRIYSNLFSTIRMNERSELTLGWDFGMQTSSISSSQTWVWNGLLGIFHYQLKPGKWSTAIRFERFMDPENVLFALPATTPARFVTNHASVNIDWQPLKNLLVRAEANYLSAPDPLFYKGSSFNNNQFSSFLVLSYNFVSSK